jgi:hypothetical protein
MMNPLSWSREHQLALLVAALIGAALATVLGYLVYASGWGEGAVPFESWILRLFAGPLWWALFGAVIGGASIFVRNLMRGPIMSTASRPGVLRGERPGPDLPPDRAQHRIAGRTQERIQERPQDRPQERPQDRSPIPPRPRW